DDMREELVAFLDDIGYGPSAPLVECTAAYAALFDIVDRALARATHASRRTPWPRCRFCWPRSASAGWAASTRRGRRSSASRSDGNRPVPSGFPTPRRVHPPGAPLCTRLALSASGTGLSLHDNYHARR